MKALPDDQNRAASSGAWLRSRFLALCAAASLAAACGGSSSVVASPGSAADGQLSDVLETARAGHNVPAMAAMLIEDGLIIEMATVGTRVINQPEVVTTDDQWHVGSITKSMTSTLAAVLIEQGLLDWDTTVADVLLGLVPDMRNEYRDVRIEQLMAHTGGLREDITQSPSFAAGNLSNTSMIPMMDKRLMWTADLLRMAPQTGVGTHLYSNANYIVLGAILEQVTGEQWEDLMNRELFAPLGMINTGFGAPSMAGMRTQPWGHATVGGIWQPFDPGSIDADNTLAIGPAGTVHSTLRDFSAYVAAHLNGARGNDGLLLATSFARLHTPQPGTSYGGGWVVNAAGWAGIPAIWHNGSNGRWFAHTVIAKDRNAAVFVVSNSKSRAAVEDMINVMIRRFETM